MRPPRRHAGQIVIGIFFGLVVVALGGFLYYRFGRPSGDQAETVTGEPDAAPAVTFAEPGPKPTDAGMPAEEDTAAVDPAAPDATPPLALGNATEEDAGAGAEAGATDGADVSAVDAPPGVAPIPACEGPLEEARELWRGREREEAFVKLGEAIACNPLGVDAPLQWGRWVVDRPALLNDRELSAAGAEAVRPAAEANPDHGELWFHYTNLLYGSRQRDAAQAAKQHCMSIRPGDDYSRSCRFLPL